MKNLFLIALIVLGFSINSFAQTGVTDVASASASIITPITIQKNVDLNFGNLAVNATSGHVVLTPALATTRTPDGGVTLPPTNLGTISAAKFTVTGLAGSVFSINMPATIDLKNSSDATKTMTLHTSFSPATGSTITGGSIFLYVGGTLDVNGSKLAGSYTNTTELIVRVDYN